MSNENLTTESAMRSMSMQRMPTLRKKSLSKN